MADPQTIAARPTVRRRWAGDTEQLRDMRRWLTGHLTDVNESLVHIVVTIASELAANAIAHTFSGSPHGHYSVSVGRTGAYVWVAVNDQGSECTVPTVKPPDDGRESGRGLAVVDAMVGELGGTWGHNLVPGGRRTWAKLPLTP